MSIAATPPPGAQAVTVRTPAGAAIEAPLRAALARTDVPGLVALATSRDRVIYQAAFGVADVATGRALAPDALFRIASMTKPITSLAAMQLVEQGAFALDDPVAIHLPELARLPVFASFDAATGDYRLVPSSRPMTVRHALTHTSGLGYPFTSATLRDFKPRSGETYPFGPLLFEPGEQWWYGTSTDVVGRLVERVSGLNLEDYFRRYVFNPLGMRDTSYRVAPEQVHRLVAAQQRDGAGMGGTIVRLANQPDPAFWPPIGGGGLVSTAADYGRFLRMLLNEGALDGARVLKPETVAIMGRNQIGALRVRAHATALPRSRDFRFIADGRDQWGLGFLITAEAVPGKRSAGSLSWGGINNTYFWLDPARGVAGVLMMQYLPFADPQALAVYDAFERAVYRLVDAEE